MPNSFRDQFPSRPIRGLPPGENVLELTLRTFQGYRLLKPTKQMNAAILGTLGRAASLYPQVRLIAFWFLSNHYTILVRTSDQHALSAFVRHLNKNIGKQVRREHGWNEHTWGRRVRCIQVGVSELTQESRLIYLLSQGTKEGLVRRPADWRGVSSLRALLYGEPIIGIWFDRTKEYEANRRWKPGTGKKRKVFPTKYVIELAPLPCWDALDVREQRRRVRKMVRQIERDAAYARGSKPVVGMKKILTADPHRRPKQVAEGAAPICHGTREEKETYVDWYEEHVDRFRDASERFRAGDLSAWKDFPKSSFPPAVPPTVVLKLRNRTIPSADVAVTRTA